MASDDLGKEPNRSAAPCPGVALVGDGYDLWADLALDESPAAITICYRPALPEATLEYRARDRDTGEKSKAALMDFLAPNIQGWSGVYRRDPQGNWVPVPYSRESLGKIAAPYLDKAFEFVAGYKPGRWEADAKN